MSLSNCVFCGAKASIPVVFPETFTAYQLLQAGDKACELCAGMFVDPVFRRNCWIWCFDGVFRRVADPLGLLHGGLPAPPFLLYLTKKKRKHGWILSVQNPVLNRDKFILVVDEEKIMFERSRFEEYYVFCKRLFDMHAIPKSILLGGMPKPSDIKRYCLAWADCFKLRSYERDMLWRCVVEFSRRS